MTSADYSPYCVTAPVDARLPGGGGNQLCGYFDINPNKFGQTLNVIQEANHFGTPEDVYDGVDINESVRLARGINVSGGVSIGRERLNNCYAQNDLSLMSAFAGARLHEPLRRAAAVPAERQVPRRVSAAVVAGFRRAPRSRAFPDRRSRRATPPPTPRLRRRSAATCRPA